MKKRMLAALLALVMLVSVMPAPLAEETPVAKIGDITYGTLDAAVDAAKEGDTIELLANCETAGMELSEDLIIDGGKTTKYTLTFTNKGITLIGKSLTFKNCRVEMLGICSPMKETPDEEDWMTIIAKTNASLILENTEMVMDLNNATSSSTNGGATHAIYCIGNNTLKLTDSKLTIKNYNQDALEWNGGNGGYNVTFMNSEFVSDHNRSGFAGTFGITVENSSVKVVNSTGNGSNGSHFDIKNSTVDFSNNNGHGLSAGNLSIDGSTVTAIGNGANGVHVGGKLEIKNKSTVTIQENDCSICSKYTMPGALYINDTSTIADSTVTITNNKGSGIYQKNGSLTVDPSATLTITNNKAVELDYGGGVNAHGTMKLPANVVLYNNHADKAGDDIYTGTFKFVMNNGTEGEVNTIGNITFGDVGTDWVLDDCNHMIDGWYEDGLEGDAPLRWNVHATETAKHVVKKNSGTYTEAIAYKAAHGEEYYEPDENPIADYILPALWLNTKDHYSYLIGYADGTVKPEGKITRAEVATIFFRLLTDDARAKFWSSTNDYTDVPAGKWYNNAISTLSNMGVIGGYADGTFRPDAPISRAEFAKIAVSFSNVADLSYRGYFADVRESDWFSGFVAAAKDAGLIEGYNDGTFQPEKAITRAEVCTIVNRTLGRKPSASHMKISDRIDWPDVSVTDWYYEAIMEATNSHTYQMGQRVETWNDKLPQRDWALLETGWANAYTGNGGEVH